MDGSAPWATARRRPRRTANAASRGATASATTTVTAVRVTGRLRRPADALPVWAGLAKLLGLLRSWSLVAGFRKIV